jgi:hypothetical protein
MHWDEDFLPREPENVYARNSSASSKRWIRLVKSECPDLPTLGYA